MRDVILTCNTGSNSLKCALYEKNGKKLLYRYEVDYIHSKPHHKITQSNKTICNQEKSNKVGYRAGLNYFIHWLKENETDMNIKAVGHRIVHGGKEFDKSVIITNSVYKKIKSLIPLAPLHQPYGIKLIELLERYYKNIIQIACFDTAFHFTRDWIAKQFAIPHKIAEEEHILRYGFHGLSYEYIANQLPEYVGKKADGRVIVAHLGGGASMCAMKQRKSISTTMGLTALDGLMMGTRCGNIDPGVILYLLQKKNMKPKQIETLLYKESGMLGVSGISHDTRDLMAHNTKKTKQTIELFCHMAAQQLGALIMELGGCDILVFTGGIGCNQKKIRTQICNYLKWMGAKLDETENAQHNNKISAPKSPIDIYIIPTDEEAIIAKHTAYLLNGAA